MLYVVSIGGESYVTISVTKNYKNAKRDADEWKAKGYDDVIIERIRDPKLENEIAENTEIKKLQEHLLEEMPNLDKDSAYDMAVQMFEEQGE